MKPLLLFFVLCILNLHLISNADAELYRLPKTLKPLRYILTLEPNLEPNLDPAPFNGSVVIDLKVTENTNKITFHINDINIDESSLRVTDEFKEERNISGTTSDSDNETYTVILETELEINSSYTLTIGHFSSYLPKQISGFYLAKYKDEDGNERRMAVSDFEPGDARTAFPCFDEPALKAKFQVNLIRHENYTSISNEKLVETVNLGNGRYQDRFKETPPISTYVVAFIVSDLKSTELVERHRMFAVPIAVKQGKLDYSLNVSVRTLRELEEYLKINYSLTKVDQVALPRKYFKMGAMENWGLIIYNGPLLYCTNTSTADDMKTCTAYIAHELTHQWFGNLVTPSWWDYVWLSESFANYFQYHIASIIEPSWQLKEQFIIDSLQKAFDQDDKGRNENAINYHVTRIREFPESWIVYQKGGSIIRMAKYFLTDEIFRMGLHIFLEDRKYNSAEPSDLYRGLQNAVNDADKKDLLGNLTIEQILSTWLDNPGYPVVNVARDYKSGSVNFQQKQFYRAYAKTDDQEKSAVWNIPMTYKFSSNTNENISDASTKFWLSEKSLTVNENFPKDGWLLVNIQQAGYYRVNYDIENWQRLIHFMINGDFESIPVINRAQLIDDAFDLARAYQLPMETALRLGEYLLREKDYLPFGAFFEFINHLQHLLSVQDEYAVPEDFLYFGNYSLTNDIYNDLNEYQVFQEYVKHILENIYKHLGFKERPNDRHTDKLNRGLIYKWLCDFDHSGCTEDVKNAFKRFRESNGNAYIPPDVQGTVFCKGVQTQEDWNFLNEFRNNTEDEILSIRIGEGLECNKQFGDLHDLD